MLFLIASLMLIGNVRETPIVCNLNALTAAEREQHAATGGRLKAAVVRIDDLPDGYRLYLDSSLPAGELLTWVEAERRCCPFLDFEIRLEREDGKRWLQLTGREGVKAFLQQEIAALRGSGGGEEQ